MKQKRITSIFFLGLLVAALSANLVFAQLLREEEREISRLFVKAGAVLNTETQERLVRNLWENKRCAQIFAAVTEKQDDLKPTLAFIGVKKKKPSEPKNDTLAFLPQEFETSFGTVSAPVTRAIGYSTVTSFGSSTPRAP